MEIKKTWDEMSEKEQFIVAATHALGYRKNGINVSDEHFLRMLNLAHPTVIWTDGTQVRIAPESLEVTKLIIKTYIDE